MTANPRCEACPIEGPACRSYPVLCAHYARDPERYAPIVAQVNGAEPPPPAPPRKLLPLRVARRAMKIGHKSCFYASPCGCAGGGAFCHRLARVVDVPDCAECLDLDTGESR